MNKSVLKWASIVIAVSLIIMLYMLPKKSLDSSSPDNRKEDISHADNFEEQYIERALAQAPNSLIADLKHIEDSITAENCLLFNAIASKWLEYQRYGIAAIYLEKCYHSEKNQEAIRQAAENYLEALRFTRDSLELRFYGEKAISSYEICLSLDSANLDLKTALGVALVETGNNPMQGITLLREVLAINPKHETAILNMGFFSIRSGQYDKAIERFESLLLINPALIETYLYLGESYQQLGKKKQAIKQFERFLHYSEDEELKKEVKSYINQLKNNL